MTSDGTRGTVPYAQRVGPLRLSFVEHAPAAVIGAHDHATATLFIVLSGDYEESVAGSSRVVMPMSVVGKPSGAVHANRIGPRGARSLLLEVDAEELPALGEVARAFVAPHRSGSSPVAPVAIRLAMELTRGDEVSSLVLDSLAMEWLAIVAGDVPRLRRTTPPRWLGRLRDRLHDAPTTELRLADLAAEAGCHASYVTRLFRRCYGMSVGEYSRALRIAHAARAMAGQPRAHLSRVALDAGYYDHSHLTRDFQARTGSTPMAWRELVAAAASM